MFVVAGESLIDLVAAPRGDDGILRLEAHPGGSPYNCAIGLAKLGKQTGFLCPISRDGFGGLLLEPLAAAGVRPLLTQRVAAPSSLAVVLLDEKREAQYEFYRGADRAFTREGLIAALPRTLTALQIGGFCAIEPEDAETWLAVAEHAAGRGAVISIDPNVRPTLVKEFGPYSGRLEKFFDLAHVVKVSVEDLLALEKQRAVRVAELPADETEVILTGHVKALLARPHCELVIVTLGAEGSRIFSRAGFAAQPIFAPPVLVDTVGAGDCLMAGALTKLAELGQLEPGRLGELTKRQLSDVLRFGAVVAGLNCGQKGCVPPTRSEVDVALSQGLSRM